MDFVQKNTDASLWVDLEQRADATPTYTVYLPSGGTAQASATATLDSVNTTLSGAASAGASTVSVASATGITVGRRYLIGGLESAGGEWITVKSIASTTVTLVRPLAAAKASGATFQSTRVTCALTGANFTTIARHYRIEIAWAVSAVTQPNAVLPFDVVRFFPISTLTFEDVSDLDPLVRKRMAAGMWWPALRDQTWKMLLSRVAAKVDPGALVGTVDLTVPHQYLVRKVLAETAGPEWTEHHDKMALRFREELDAILGAHAVDDDQDGNVERHEGWRHTIVVQRG